MSFQGLFESARKRKKEKCQPPSEDPTKRYQHPPDKRRPDPLPNKKRKRGGPVSQQALALSAQLKELSRQKRLDQVLDLYWNATDRDAHHAGMVIDCCARCGNVAEAERVFREAENTNSVEIHTALLKAFAHAGQMAKADALFRRMCSPQSLVTPNVRTLNTLLRGCLWTAACLNGDSIVGGVITSEQAWELYKAKAGVESMDASSYEYSISLLCQALRVQEAQQRIDHFMDRNQIHFKGKASLRGGDQTSLETLAVAFIALAKAHVLLGSWDETWTACQRSLSAVEGSKASALSDASNADASQNQRHKEATGGRKSWNASAETGSQRQASNSSFRSHRLSELEMEARTILKMRNGDTRSGPIVSKSLLTRLFYFSGGGTTELDTVDKRSHATTTREDQQRRLLVPAWYSFGLSSLLDEGGGSPAKSLNIPDPEEVYRRVGLEKLMKKIITSTGRIEVDQLFSSADMPIDVELGSGFGDWIENQAQANPTRNYFAVEIRADRVSQIFIKTTLLRQLPNVCVVASDAASFFRTQLPFSRIANVYVNHPEPPTQTLGDSADDLTAIMNGADEPAHMLSSTLLIAVAAALVRGGKLCIVSDNRWYSRLICATLVKANRSGKCKMETPSPFEAKELGLQVVESFASGAVLHRIAQGSTQGTGKTWFDRLWQTGAGRHAERTTRYAIVVTKQ